MLPLIGIFWRDSPIAPPALQCVSGTLHHGRVMRELPGNLRVNGEASRLCELVQVHSDSLSHGTGRDRSKDRSGHRAENGDQALAVGPPAPLFSTRLATGANVTGAKPQYAVAPDGRFLLNTRVDEGTSPPLTVVVNWYEALARSAASR